MFSMCFYTWQCLRIIKKASTKVFRIVGKKALHSDHKNADFLYKNSDNRILQEFLQDVKMETSNLIVLHTRDMPVNCHLIFIQDVNDAKKLSLLSDILSQSVLRIGNIGISLLLSLWFFFGSRSSHVPRVLHALYYSVCIAPSVGTLRSVPPLEPRQRGEIISARQHQPKPYNTPIVSYAPTWLHIRGLAFACWLDCWGMIIHRLIMNIHGMVVVGSLASQGSPPCCQW